MQVKFGQRRLRRLKDLMHDSTAAWNRFWFRPADPTLLGLIRLCTGLMLVYTHAVWGLELEAFFGPNSWLSPEAAAVIQQGQAAFSFWWYVPAELLWPVHYACLTVFALFTLGVLTRVTSLLSLVIAVSYAYRTPSALFGLDQINVMLTLYCCVGPAGAALSVDQLVRRFRSARQQVAAGIRFPQLTPAPSSSARVSLRLIQLHMCLIYFFAGVSKLQGPAWWSGEAMWLAFANLEYQSMDMTWLARWPLLINVATHTTIIWEISFPALIWSRRWRPLVLFFGTLMHLGIGACLGMWTFGLIMLVGCGSFLPPASIRRMVRVIFGTRHAWTVLYDGSCSVCQRAAGRVAGFDLSRRLQLVDCHAVDPAQLHAGLDEEDCLRDLQVLTHDGRCLTGVEARLALARNIRLLWPLACVLQLPGIHSLVFRWFTGRQQTRIDSGACGVSLSQWRDTLQTVAVPEPVPVPAPAAAAKPASVTVTAKEKQLASH